jgi:heat shock protein HtpX
VTLQQQIRANRWRTLLLLVLFAALFGGLGLILGLAFDPSLLVVVGVAALLYAFFSYWAAGSMVAAMTGAKKVTKADYPELYRALENAAIGAGLTQTPDLRVIDDPAPNAFAAGRNPKTAYVAVTTGLVQLLDQRELEGVLAHEISHIRNRDVRLMTLVALLVGIIALLSDFLLRITFWGGGGKKEKGNVIIFAIALAALVLAPIAAILIQMAVSRRREYLADAGAAEITGDGEGIALALRKLQLDTKEIRHANRATAHLYIESPLNQASGAQASLKGIFDTHPPLADRIARLEEAGGFRLPPLA